MKLKIEKTPKGLRVEIATEPKKKPIVLVLDDARLEIVLSMLKTAKNADTFSFQLEL